MKFRLLFLIHLILIGGILGLGYINDSYLEIISGVCAAIFWCAQVVLFFYLDKKEEQQKKRGKIISFLLLLPAFGMFTNGILIFQSSFINMPLEAMYCVMGLSVLLFILLQIQIITKWKNNTLAGRFFKRVSVAGSLIPFSLFIVLTLQVTGSTTEKVITLSSLTILVLSSIILLMVLTMILVSICQYRSMIESIQVIYKLIKDNKLKFIRASVIKDFLLGVGKLIISILSVSFFMFVNVLYNVGMGIARVLAIKMHSQDGKKQVASYRLVGIIISISSICYVLYSVRLFFGGKTGTYSMNVALLIAFYTFVEFGVNIRDAFRLRRSNALEAKSLRAISLSSTLICFVLTQTAIMSFAAVGDNSIANALSGVFFGGLATIVGLYVIFDSIKHRRRCI